MRWSLCVDNRGRRPSLSSLANWFGLGEDDLYGRLTIVKTIPNVSHCSLAGAFVTLWVAFVTSQVAAGQLGGEDDFWGRFQSAQLTGLVVADRILAVSISHVLIRRIDP